MSRRLAYLLLLLPLALSGCTAVRDQSKRFARNVEHEAKLSQAKIQDLMTLKPEKDTTPKPMPPAYCYRVMQDIMCYNQPLAGAERRLVGRQGVATVAVAAPVEPVPAPASQPVVVWEEPSPSAGTAWNSGSVKLQEVKPIYVGSPPEVAGKKE